MYTRLPARFADSGLSLPVATQPAPTDSQSMHPARLWLCSACLPTTIVTTMCRAVSTILHPTAASMLYGLLRGPDRQISIHHKCANIRYEKNTFHLSFSPSGWQHRLRVPTTSGWLPTTVSPAVKSTIEQNTSPIYLRLSMRLQ